MCVEKIFSIQRGEHFQCCSTSSFSIGHTCVAKNVLWSISCKHFRIKASKGLSRPPKFLTCNWISAFVIHIMCMQVVSEYMMGGRVTDMSPLHTASCRLLLDVLPGLETSVVFQETVSHLLLLAC